MTRSRFTPVACVVLLTLVGLSGGGCAAMTGRRPAAVASALPYGPDDPRFRRDLADVLGPPVVEGNSAAELVNGDEIFPAMLGAIRSARETITFETYIYWSDSVGRTFTDALIERARDGVRVHVIVDAIGSRNLKRGALKRLSDAGVDVVALRPVKWYDPLSLATLNHRTHRRVLVIDGRVGFAGGAAVADMWKGDVRKSDQWRDTHYRFEGPVVAQLQTVFMDNWREARGRSLKGPGYFPPLTAVADNDGCDCGTAAQVICSGVGSGNRSVDDAVRLTYLMAVAAAREHVRISAAYFVPDRAMLDAIKAARERGVEVEIILPGDIMDVPVVRSASRTTWGHLLRAGARLYEYQPAMYHCKVLIVDDCFVSVGSANLDPRSFELNDEANVNVLCCRFARRQIEVFEQDKARSREIDYDQWRTRPIADRLGDGFASLLGPQL